METEITDKQNTPEGGSDVPTCCDRPNYEELCGCVGIVCSDRLNARFETEDEYHGRLSQATMKQQYDNGADWYFAADCKKCDNGVIRHNVTVEGPADNATPQTEKVN